MISNYGFPLEFNTGKDQVFLNIIEGSDLDQEGYILKVDKGGIHISASKSAGIFYGFQTFKQLMPLNAIDRKIEIGFIEIEDFSRFRRRGNMLDVGRHFFPVSFLKHYIDILASYKLNVFLI